jgi:hypothetical protein
MQSVHCCTWLDLEGKEVEVLVGAQEEGIDLLQCLEDSIGHLRGEMGMWAVDAQYLTLHGGVGALGGNFICLQQELTDLGKGLSMAAQHMEGLLPHGTVS